MKPLAKVPTPPPCDQVCWEPAGDGWRYIASSDRCGHQWDPNVGVWRWHAGHPIPPRHRAA